MKVGSIFYVSLPFIVEDYAVNTITNELPATLLSLVPLKKELDLGAPINLPKILIVDDNIDMIAYLQELFSTSSDCMAAFKGQEALSLIKKQPFDLIISDLRMPLTNGLQLKKELNKTAAYKDIPSYNENCCLL
jgi:PleD family two-component response regulator